MSFDKDAPVQSSPKPDPIDPVLANLEPAALAVLERSLSGEPEPVAPEPVPAPTPEPEVPDEEAVAFAAELARMDAAIEQAKSDAAAATAAYEEAQAVVAASEAIGADTPPTGPEADAATNQLVKAQAAHRLALLRMNKATEALAGAQAKRRAAVTAEHRRKARKRLSALTDRRIAIVNRMQDAFADLHESIQALEANRVAIVGFLGAGAFREQHAIEFFRPENVVAQLRTMTHLATGGAAGERVQTWGVYPGMLADQTARCVASLHDIVEGRAEPVSAEIVPLPSAQAA